MTPLISVIVPVYNVENYLSKCVRSILSQTYENLEIILVDDGSKDNSGELCEEIALSDRRVRVLHKANGGLSSARNAGLEVSSGEYISFIDSDDYIASDFYETLVNSMTSNRTLACSHIVRVDEDGSITPRNDLHISGGSISTKEYVKELLLHIGDVSVCSKLFRRELIGSKRFDETKLNEDLLFMMDLLSDIDSIKFTGRTGYYYLCRRDSISSKYGKAIEDMVGNSLVFREKALDLYPDLEEEANRFVLFQHMAFLLLIPKHEQRNNGFLFKNAKRYVRKRFCSEGLFNNYLSAKNKLILLGQIFVPGLIGKLYQRRH